MHEHVTVWRTPNHACQDIRGTHRLIAKCCTFRTLDCEHGAAAPRLQVLVTPHSAFLTMEALDNIAKTTVDNLLAFQHGQELVNIVKPL